MLEPDRYRSQFWLHNTCRLLTFGLLWPPCCCLQDPCERL